MRQEKNLFYFFCVELLEVNEDNSAIISLSSNLLFGFMKGILFWKGINI